MTTPDEIRRYLELDVAVERVWAALTTREGLLAWFPTHRADIELQPGGRLSLGWAEEEDEGIVDVVDPPRRLVFRWRPAGSERPYTTVEFTLGDLGGRTRLSLVESGFSSLPVETREGSRDANDRGWSDELGELQTYLGST